jgi:hypothetical protein
MGISPGLNGSLLGLSFGFFGLLLHIDLNLFFFFHFSGFLFD